MEYKYIYGQSTADYCKQVGNLQISLCPAIYFVNEVAKECIHN